MPTNPYAYRPTEQLDDLDLGNTTQLGSQPAGGAPISPLLPSITNPVAGGNTGQSPDGLGPTTNTGTTKQPGQPSTGGPLPTTPEQPPAATGPYGLPIAPAAPAAPAGGSTGIVGSAMYQPAARDSADQASVMALIDKYTGADSDFRRRIEGRAEEAANARGLQNSSMARGAATAAMLDAITPVASQDAAMINQRAMAAEQNNAQAGIASMQIQAQQNEAAANRQFQQFMQGMSNEQQRAMADLGFSQQQWLTMAQQGQQNATNYASMLTQIMGASMPTDTRTAAIEMLNNIFTGSPYTGFKMVPLPAFKPPGR